MYLYFKHFHSYIAILAVAFIIFALVINAYAWIKKKPFSKTIKHANLLGLIWTHIQFLVGLIFYFISPLGFSGFSGELMKNPVTRLYLVEHPLSMIMAVVLITFGYMKAKNQTEIIRRYKKIVLFYFIALLFILIRIPWKNWTLIN